MVFSIRQQMVIGPTPPGTGVITEALGSMARQQEVSRRYYHNNENVLGC